MKKETQEPTQSKWAAPTKHSKKIKIMALETGFYVNRRIRKGQVAWVYEEYFSSRWMKKYDPEQEALDKEQALIAESDVMDTDEELMVPARPKAVHGGKSKGAITGSKQVI